MADKPPKKGRPRGSGSFPWRAFFQQSVTPVFVLGKGRRLRFANPAWEKLAGLKLADALGLVCSARRHSSPLAAALAPTPEAESGTPDRVRRAAPGARAGTLWWDIAFEPLAGEGGIHGIVGFITVVGESAPAAARRVPASVAALRDRHAAQFTPELFAGQTRAGERFLGQLRHAAHTTTPVWLVGEPGSGKATAARVVHHSGPNRERAFAAIECAGLQPYLIESLLFGPGGMLASGHLGTLYLRDPAALPRDLQQKLADFLSGEAAAPRLISGSTRTAAQDVAAGTLVPDFQTHLSILELCVPPLRDRVADLERFTARLLPGAKVDGEVFTVLRAQPWPVNWRELADALAEAAARAGDGPIRREHLPRELRVRAGIEPPATPPRAITLDPILEAVERRMIRIALTRTNNHQTEAAELLGIFRARLGRRLETLGIAVPAPPVRPRPKPDDATEK